MTVLANRVLPGSTSQKHLRMQLLSSVGLGALESKRSSELLVAHVLNQGSVLNMICT